MGTFSIWHWLIVLLVVVLVFGSKKLVNVGPDLGKAIRGFQKSMRDGGKDGGENAPEAPAIAQRESSADNAAPSPAEKSASS